MKLIRASFLSSSELTTTEPWVILSVCFGFVEDQLTDTHVSAPN